MIAALAELRVDAVALPDIDAVNELEMLIVAGEQEVDELLWQQAERVVGLLRAGMSQRELAGQWLNARTGKPYSQVHVCYVARVIDKFTYQPRPRFRQAYNEIANSAKRAENLDAHLSMAAGDPADIHLHLASCVELFASGIQPDAVITILPRGREQLDVISEFARAACQVPLVAVDVGTDLLPEGLGRLCEWMSYRGGFREWRNELWLLFCHDDRAFECAKARAIPGRSSLRPYDPTAVEYFVQRLAAAGELVCDPFLGAETAIAALMHGRRFVGGSTDRLVVDDVRRQIGGR